MKKIVKYLILSDIFMISAFGLIVPIFAIFINENIIGGSIVTAGFASSIYLVTKAALQIPFARIADKHGARKKFLIIGVYPRHQ